MKSWKPTYMIACLAILIHLLAATPGPAAEPLSVICDIWPPYQFIERGRLVGFSTEMVQDVFKAMDVDITKIKTYPWKRAISMFGSSHIDALYSANYTKDRTVFAHYPDEMLFESPWIIWSREGDKYTSLEELKGKTIGVVRGYSYTEEFWDFIETNCDVEEVSNDMVNFRKLSAKRIDAVVAELGNGYHLIKQLNIKNITPQHDITIKRDGLYILFNRETITKKFVDEFSRTLELYKK